MKCFSGSVLVLTICCLCLAFVSGRPQAERKEINREQSRQSEDLESGAEDQDLNTAASSYGYGYYGGYYPPYYNRRYTNPYYSSYGYYGPSSPYYTSRYSGLGGLYGGFLY